MGKFHKTLIFSLVLGSVAFSYEVPFITLACKTDPNIPPVALENGKYLGVDCISAQSALKGIAEIPDEVSPNSVEYVYHLSEESKIVSRQAEALCGEDCRFFYETVGHQCMTVAQSTHATGLGAFVSGAKTQKEAEKYALDLCHLNLGPELGRDCTLVVSECTLENHY